ncbi:HEAT repeat domain-containing protein [Chlorogloeopsis sp. ULAP01]|uniref:HEAT repeat domain-containing protein n=1 Tax=Chlorogloeopsis sp. ULAP01 TaxID=3056483 RepID=UPI0025AA8B00|nr:HEAT repeat domain-containing protein [Chlorogloeopsis sp. ULAP01]MDM9384507.1 HEAT repeat domain-containing protein [Chlorogloeopsis sp. ULAP01]
MLMNRYTYKLRFYIAIAFVCLSSPLLADNPTWAQSATQTQINSYIQRLKNPQQRSTAVDYLASVGKPAVPALIKALQDTNPQMRAGAAMTLGKIGPAASEAAIVLMRTIGDKDPTVRSYVVQAIEKIGRKAYIPYFITALNSDKKWERYSATHALRAMGKDAATAVPALIKTLEDKDMWMRVNAASALGYIGTPSAPALPALVARLQDKDETVRNTAAYAVSIIGLSLQEDVSQLSTSELDRAVSSLEKALKVLQTPSLQYRQEAITSVQDPLVALQKERRRRVKSFLTPSPKWRVNYPSTHHQIWE